MSFSDAKRILQAGGGKTLCLRSQTEEYIRNFGTGSIIYNYKLKTSLAQQANWNMASAATFLAAAEESAARLEVAAVEAQAAIHAAEVAVQKHAQAAAAADTRILICGAWRVIPEVPTEVAEEEAALLQAQVAVEAAVRHHEEAMAAVSLANAAAVEAESAVLEAAEGNVEAEVPFSDQEDEVYGLKELFSEKEIDVFSDSFKYTKFFMSCFT